MVYEEITDPFRRLVRIMERLQEPGGCPWDLEQTHESLKPYMIEEAYEALDAIDSGDDTLLAEELGDVLLQVLFHSALSKRTGRFTVDEVIEAASAKMVRRHPHVFGETEAATAADVLHNWEKLKSEERAGKAMAGGGEATSENQSALAGVPRQLPALLRAFRMQEKAARVGFAWKERQRALDKVAEEAAELQEAVDGGDRERAQAELGDLLFSLVAFGRMNGLDAEEGLRGTCNTFAGRFAALEAHLRAEGRHVQDVPEEELLALWRGAARETGAE